MDSLYLPATAKLSLPLAYQQEIFREVYNEDALVVVARGLGLQQIVVNLLHSYDILGNNLVILVGANELENSKYGEELAEKAAISRSSSARGLVVINTDVTNVASREKLYSRGGVFTVTSRILAVDLLTGLLSPEMVTGIVILHAERITATSLEAFIVRIYRQKNKEGFLKAFSESPDSFASGFSPLSTIMNNLFIRKSSLWPRYHLRVAQSLEAKKAEVIELEVSMTPAMQTMQTAVLQCIEVSISELRKSNVGLDLENWDVESALHSSFDALVRRQLDPVWHRVSSRTKQIATDLTSLRNILSNLLSLDAVAFHQYLETIIAANAPTNNPSWQNQSPWLFLDAAETLFSTARQRVYTGDLPNKTMSNRESNLKMNLEEQPKWQVLSEVLEEIAANSEATSGQDIGGPTLIMCPDRYTCSQLAEYLYTVQGHERSGGRESPEPETSSGFMQRKFLAFMAWKHDFAKSRSSQMFREQNKSFKNPVATVSSRKAPANKRRRVRGAPQFSVGSRNQDTFRPGKANTSPQFVGNISHDSSEALFEEELMGPQEFIDADFYMHEPKDTTIIHPYEGDSDDSILEELRPRNIIMYSPDASFIRRVEVFRSSHTSNEVRIYFMYYGGSMEEQTYLSKVRREKDSFTKLIRQKANMAMTLNNNNQLIDNPQDHFLRTLNTRIAGGGRTVATAEPPRVVVDIREFRSSLPSLLHGKGTTIVPCTLTVADYVLTPKICVERKSVKDLISSFKDGRLYSQVEAMLSNYKDPMLLIEFDQDKSFSLEPFMDLSSKATSNQSDLQSKLVLLTLHFPKLRIIWSSSPYQTAEIFEELKKNQEEPDPLKAVSIGLADGEDEFSIYAPVPIDMLKSIPGISDKNYRKFIFEVDNIADLCNSDEKDLLRFIGPEFGRQVHRFFNRNIYDQDGDS